MIWRKQQEVLENYILQKLPEILLPAVTQGGFLPSPMSDASTGHPKSHLSLPWRAQMGQKGWR